MPFFSIFHEKTMLSCPYFVSLWGSILRYECQFWASYINSGDLGDDFGTSGSLFGLLIVNFVHLEVVFRPVKGKIQHCFSN